MPRRYHANNFSTTLATGIGTGATSITLTSATGLPAIGTNEVYRLTLRYQGRIEIVEVTDDASSPTLTVTRAQESTTAQAFPAGSLVELRATANSIDRKSDGASSSTDNALARFDGTSGKILQDSGTTTDDDGNLTSNNLKRAYTTTTTAAGTTTLTVSSTGQQFFTGSTTQTVVLPVVSTLSLGHSYYIVNNSTGVITVQSSGGNTVQAMAASTFATYTCILTSGTTAASWSVAYSASGAAGISEIQGTTNQITVTNGTGPTATIAITSNPTLPGADGVTLPQGSTASRPGASVFARLRGNTSTGRFEFDNGSAWRLIPTTAETITANRIPKFAGANNPDLDVSNLGIDANNNITGAKNAIVWNEVTGTTQAASVANAYITNNTSRVNVTLPATVSVGDIVRLAGKGSGGWQLTANTGQTIQVGAVATTTAGNVQSADRYDTIEVICITANTTWLVLSGVTAGYTIN